MTVKMKQKGYNVMMLLKILVMISMKWNQHMKNGLKNTIIYRSSHPEVFYKKGVLRNFAKFTEKHLCQGLFFNKVAGLQHFQEHLF